jgi:hypothetical protein
VRYISVQNFPLTVATRNLPNFHAPSQFPYVSKLVYFLPPLKEICFSNVKRTELAEHRVQWWILHISYTEHLYHAKGRRAMPTPQDMEGPVRLTLRLEQAERSNRCRWWWWWLITSIISDSGRQQHRSTGGEFFHRLFTDNERIEAPNKWEISSCIFIYTLILEIQ